MQTAMRTTGLQSAGRAQLPRGQRGCAITRASVSAHETAAHKDQQSLALATFLASSVVAVASAAPALADEVAVATLTAPSTEVSIGYSDVIAELYEPIPSVVAPSLTEVVDTPLAPELLPVFEVASSSSSAAAESYVVLVLDEVAEAAAVPTLEVAAAPTLELAVPTLDEVPAPVAEVAPVLVVAEAVAVEEVAVEEVAAAPVAVVAEAEPVAAEAEPAAAEAEPAVAEAEPVVAEAEPVVAEAEPVVAEAEPVAVEAVEAAAPAAEAEVEAAQAEVPAVEAVEAAAPVVAVEEEVAAAAASPVVAEEVAVPVVAAVEAAPLEEEEQAAAPVVVEEEVPAPVVAAAEATEPVVPEVVEVVEEAPAAAVVAATEEVEAAAAEPVVAATTTAAAEEAAAAAPAPAPGSAPFDLQRLLGGLTASAGSSGSDSGVSVETATYGTLGAAALAFVATFFVAPRFRESFKEPVEWKDMYAALSAKGVKTVTPEEAYAKAKKGAVLLDVRPADKFSSGRSAAGATSVPLYRPIAGWDAASNVRRAGFAFFGIFGTELNENFAAEVAAKVPKNKEIILMCESGGSLDNKPGTQFGFQSRSLKALYYLQQAGYTKVLHMKGGLGDWQRAGLPLADGSEQPPAGPRGGSGSISSRPGTAKGTAKGTTSAKSSVSKELVSAYTRSRR